MQEKLHEIGIGATGFIGSITLGQVPWFNMSAIHDLIGSVCQLSIAAVTIYFMIKKKTSKNDESNEQDN